MGSLASYVAGGLAVALAIDLVAPLPRASRAMDLAEGTVLPHSVAFSGTMVDRTFKGDRLTVAAPARSAPQKIASVEIVGLGNTAVVYRDREGRELFRTDPVSNATVVAKGVSLPEITIRYSGGDSVAPTPAIPPVGRGTPDGKPPVGCEPPISPLAGTAPTSTFSRCIVQRLNEDDRAVALAFLAQSVR